MLTNRCNEGCKHCMSDCKPEGTDMDLMTLGKVVKFAKFIGSRFLILSGGELTLNPDWFRICQMLNDQYKVPFGICTNGTWVEDQKTFMRMTRVSKMKYCTGVQIYTNKFYYKSYDLVKSYEKKLNDVGLSIDQSYIRSMKDLGRAKTDPSCQTLISQEKYFMSCLNASLTAKQVSVSSKFGYCLETQAGHFCKPCVDPSGNVHMSESQLCPSVGNIIKDTFTDIWQNIRDWTPCGGCKDFIRFRDSDREDLLAAKAMLGICNPVPVGEIQQTLAQFLGNQETREDLRKLTENIRQ